MSYSSFEYGSTQMRQRKTVESRVRRKGPVAVRDSFALHYTVFKQYASHLPHEANVEQLFSRSSNLSDPNMDPEFLATLTSIRGVNKKLEKVVQADGNIGDRGHAYFKLYIVARAQKRASPLMLRARERAPTGVGWRNETTRLRRPTT